MSSSESPHSDAQGSGAPSGLSADDLAMLQVLDGPGPMTTFPGVPMGTNPSASTGNMSLGWTSGGGMDWMAWLTGSANGGSGSFGVGSGGFGDGNMGENGGMGGTTVDGAGLATVRDGGLMGVLMGGSSGAAGANGQWSNDVSEHCSVETAWRLTSPSVFSDSLYIFSACTHLDGRRV